MTALISEKLTRKFKLLFSVGDLSTSGPLTVIMFFQLYFLTDVAGLRPDLAGWAVGLGKIWDAINDPIIGLISDRIRSRFGRRRVVLLFSALPLGLTFMLLWVVPPLSQLALTAYYTLVFILFDALFTLYHVSYNSLTPEMTHDYDERSSLNGYRAVFSIAADLIVIIAITVIGWYVPDNRVLFTFVGIILGVVFVFPPLVVFKITRERSNPIRNQVLSVKAAIRATLSNKPFLLVMGLYLFSWTTASILAAVLIYFANYYLLVPEQANYFVLVAQFSAILFVPFWMWAARRWDKRRAFIYGIASWIVVLVAIASISREQVALAYILAALSGSGIATAYFLPWAMIPDVVEVDELSTGERREGSFYSFSSFFQKFGTGVAIWGLGQVLAITGYITPTPGAPLPVQPETAVQAIRLTIGAVPVILLTMSLLLAWKFPITRQSHLALRQEIQSRFNSE